ncbi:hypothetical protein [Kineococcus rhizosphaerae]|uniref:DUF5709 domain-containing protein n=1 Tax=Kineococcus rhizosphaerae TaxID=559628 RepID=A0A2T0RAZ9_9ACTN|nr:hypothetical protein [Kineococcus rhizosphaerae]PRY18329.1 hypothetical protein CLV37_101574 [Kineococcus rhizosphaerae]
MSEQPYEPRDPDVDPLADPDLQQVDSDASPSADDPEVLSNDTLMRDDQDDQGWEPENHLSSFTAEIIADGDRDDETLEERLAQEEPDVDASSGAELDSEQDYRQV